MASAEKIRDRLHWYDPLALAVLPPLASGLISIMLRSCRVAGVLGKKTVDEALAVSGGRAVYATWHQRMFYHFHYFGDMNLLMMISRSRDGEYAARMASSLGFRNVRGSSTRGGSRALKNMVMRLKNGQDSAGMLADGPQGPPRVVKMGSLIMARDTGLPLIGVMWGGEKCWVLDSWDRYMIPKPFSSVVIAYTEPMWIPEGTAGEALDELRLEFERRLNDTARACDMEFGSERPWRKVREEGQPETGHHR